MMLQIRSALGTALVIFALVAWSAMPAAAAAHHHKHHAAVVHRAYRGYAAERWRRYAYRYPPEWGYEAAVPPNAIVGPGYVFVPGKGILGENCDMPTSTCSNDYRDAQ